MTTLSNNKVSNNKVSTYHLLLLIFLGFVCFLPNIGSVHLFDWDEINFAECAREMIATGDYFRPQIDFEPFWEKPPLFIWFQVLSMKAFGINEFAARFPNVICGVLSLVFCYVEGKNFKHERFGIYWAAAMLCSILPHFYFRSGIIDPWFNFFIFSGLWYFFKGHQKSKLGNSAWSLLLFGGFLCGLGILTKGPVAYLMSGLTVALLFLFSRLRNWALIGHFILFSIAALIPALLWFGADIVRNGTWFVREFLTYNVRLASTEDSGHGGFIGYHFVVLFVGCFPASIFALRHLFSFKKQSNQVSDFTLTWNQTLFWAVLILFSLVQTKIVHYSSLTYFPLTFLAAIGIGQLKKAGKMVFWQFALLCIPALLFIMFLALLPYLGQHIELIKPIFSKDAFAMANLEAKVDWSYWQLLPPFFAFLSFVAASYFYWKKNMERAIEFTFGISFLILIFAVSSLVPRIEAYTQGAAIEFYESKKNEKCYVLPVGFKSFAHLFYTQKPPMIGDNTVDDRQLLLEKKVKPDRPVYFVAKITNQVGLNEREDVELLYRKNGFVFFRWIPK